MKLEIVIDETTALEDLGRLMDLKNMLPKRRKDLETPIEVLSEAIQYGYVSIADDGAITQKLIVPVKSTTELKYAARIDPFTIQKALKELKVDNMPSRIAAYMKAYTGKTVAELDSLEPTDRNTAESIALFFL